ALRVESCAAVGGAHRRDWIARLDGIQTVEGPQNRLRVCRTASLQELLPQSPELLAQLGQCRALSPGMQVDGRGLLQVSLKQSRELFAGILTQNDGIHLVVEQHAPIVKVG